MPDQAPTEEMKGGGRRKTPRFSLIASAELEEVDRHTRLSARVSEIGLYGCYVDALNPFPSGTLVFLRIIRDVGTFTTRGVVIYAHPGLGMGIRFNDTAPDQMAILEKWIAGL